MNSPGQSRKVEDTRFGTRHTPQEITGRVSLFKLDSALRLGDPGFGVGSNIKKQARPGRSMDECRQFGSRGFRPF
jgi:hypothetical protein